MDEASLSLSELMQLAEWTPRQWVAAINARLSSQGRDRLRLDPTAAYPWIRRGFRPRTPIPDVAAGVLSERLGFTVTADGLWPQRAEVGTRIVPATDGVEQIRHMSDVLGALRQLNRVAATPRSPVATASGADLAGIVVDGVPGVPLPAQVRAGREFVSPEQTEVISAHVAALRRLNDRHGGGALSLRYVSAFAGHGLHAVRLAEAGTREYRGDDPTLRARLLGREATAAAANGDLIRFRQRTDEALALIYAHDSAQTPPFLYYLAPEQIEAEAGQALVVLAEHTQGSWKRLLAEAINLLTPALPALAGSEADAVGPFPRSALLHTTFLARAHLLHGDVDQAVAVVDSALVLLAPVQSPRGRSYLRDIRTALARHSRSSVVRLFLPRLDEALSTP